MTMQLQIALVEGEKRIEACMTNPFYNSHFASQNCDVNVFSLQGCPVNVFHCIPDLGNVDFCPYWHQANEQARLRRTDLTSGLP
jgi:hypothetical protein